MKTKIFRHGEIVFEVIDSIPDNLKQSEEKVFLIGSNNNPHSYDNGELYFKNENDFIFGYFIAKNTKLFHLEHGKGKGKLRIANLPDGNYRLRRQVEFINKELKQIKD